jgi:uncharacterized protein YqgC (DUF456 family)
MDAWLYYLWAIILIAACGFAWLTTVIGLPGNWLIVAFAAIFAALFAQNPNHGVTWMAVAFLAVLALVGEIVEFAAGAAGAAKYGASKRSVALSLVGAAVGSIVGITIGLPIPLLGSFMMAIVGGAAGAFFGAYLGEAWKGRPHDARVAAGRGAFSGRIWGSIGKLAVGAIMLVIVAWDALFG